MGEMIYHNSHIGYYRQPFGAVPTGTPVTLRVAVRADLKPAAVTLRLWYGNGEALVKMEPAARGGAAGVAGDTGDAGIAGTGGVAGSARIAGATGDAGDAGNAESGGTAGGAEAAKIAEIAGACGTAWAAGADGASGAAETGGAPGCPADGNYETYEARYLPDLGCGLYWYYFIVECGDGALAGGGGSGQAASAAGAGARGGVAMPEPAGQRGRLGEAGQPDKTSQTGRPDQTDQPNLPDQPRQPIQLDQPGQPDQLDQPGQLRQPGGLPQVQAGQQARACQPGGQAGPPPLSQPLPPPQHGLQAQQAAPPAAPSPPANQDGQQTRQGAAAASPSSTPAHPSAQAPAPSLSAAAAPSATATLSAAASPSPSAAPAQPAPAPAQPAAPARAYYCGNNGDMLGGASIVTENPPWSYQITVYDSSLSVPGWFRHGVMYQIFPDRFFSRRRRPLTQAAVEKKRPDYIFRKDWGGQPIYKPDPRTGEIMNNDFFGGNLAGIAAKLPYLKELGASILYLNPIFEAYSNHRYDTGNYKKIDPLLGTARDFRRLCEKARGLGIRVILDGVFSHTGCDSAYFNKYGRYRGAGAYQSKSSKYYKWYSFKSYPDEYECWWNIDTLPNVVESEGSFVEYALTGEDSVVRHWLRQGASGWRLDVVDELPDEFLKTLRASVKSADGDAVIIGEVWEDASNKVSYGRHRQYLYGFELDSVMNYVFRSSLTAFMLRRMDARRFGAEMLRLCENYPKEVFYSLMNLVGGHDVARILTVLSDPPEGMSRDQKAIHRPTGAHRRIGARRLKLMALIQMTFPGVPSVYYGDEAGMEGFEDPFNRGAFPWGNIDRGIRGWFKSAIALRNSFAALRTGSFEPVLAEGAAYAYVRAIRGGRDVFGEEAGDGFALIAANAGAAGAGAFDIDLSAWGIGELFEPLWAAELARAPEAQEKGALGKGVLGKGALEARAATAPGARASAAHGTEATGAPKAAGAAGMGAAAPEPADPAGHARVPCPGGRLCLEIPPLGCRVLLYPRPQ